MSLKNKSIALVGYGSSSRAMCNYLLKREIYPVVRNKEIVPVPSGVRLITENYLDTSEDIVFRSPGIRPDRIKASGRVTTEVAYALEITRGTKIGISGSDGKTTTSSLIYNMLTADGLQATLCGNIGTPVIEYASDSTLNTYTVCELSSFQLMDMHPMLDVCAITGISENHLDWHTSMNEYIEAKAHILENAGLSILNYDDEIVRGLENRTQASALFSLHDLSSTRVSAEAIAYLKNGYLFCNGVKIISADELRLRGRFNIANALCALCVVWNIVDIEAIRHTLRTFSGAPGRMELVDSVGGVDFICSSIDSTPTRTVATLSALDVSKCVLILGGYDKGVSYAPLAEATRGLRGAVLCGANADKIESAIKNNTQIKKATRLEDAVMLAVEMARKGDAVLLSPASASFDMFNSYKEREQKFKEIVRGLKWKKSGSF